MAKPDYTEHSSIPISVSLDETMAQQDFTTSTSVNKKRLLFISVLAVLIGICISGISKLLVYLINLVTNISFHRHFSFAASSPATNDYGLWVIIVPAAGGVIVG